ncbi:MAG: hypothetical protein IKJ47_00135 [Oscillospiraceae bacterium]|nr:hypothetical protein [Oscillospiraceae bacterium]
MKKLSAKHKKILKAILIPLIIILTIFMAVNICKTANKEKIISQIEDTCIYTHTSENFLFLVNGFPDSSLSDSSENGIVLTIFYHVDQGFWGDFLGTDPYFDNNDKARKTEMIFINLPDKYNSATKAVHVERLNEKQMRLYGFAIDDYEYYNNNDFVPPMLVEMDDGTEFVVYKKFNYLFLKEIKEEIPEQASAK